MQMTTQEQVDNQKGKERQSFVNQFVNAVYGILLGYGFSNAMREIKDGISEDIGPVFGASAVFFTIVVVCIYWWDWYKAIGMKVASDYKEFTIDIAILVSLELLFFVFEYPIIYGAIFFLLSLLSLIWVANYHYNLCKDLRYPSRSKYLSQNPDVRKYFRARFIGIAMFGICLALIFALQWEPITECQANNWITCETWKGHWIELSLIIATFVIYRKFFYKPGGKRAGIEKSVGPPRRK